MVVLVLRARAEEVEMEMATGMIQMGWHVSVLLKDPAVCKQDLFPADAGARWPLS